VNNGRHKPIAVCAAQANVSLALCNYINTRPHRLNWEQSKLKNVIALQQLEIKRKYFPLLVQKNSQINKEQNYTTISTCNCRISVKVTSNFTV
jgi:hypothetical protein